MKLLLLVAALAAGGGLLNHVMNSPRPITLTDARQAADQGVQAAESAAATAEVAVDTVSGIARTGVQAAESTASYIGGALDSGSRMVDDLRRSMSESAPAPSRTMTKTKESVRGGTGSTGNMRSRPSARDALPEEMVVPQHQGQPSTAAE